MNSAQKQTLETSSTILQIHAAATAMTVARTSGIVEQLRLGQKNREELAGLTGLNPQSIEHLMRILTAVGFVEQYQDDFALSQAVRLLIESDGNLGERAQHDVERFLKNEHSPIDRELVRRRYISRQWAQSAAAIQAAEVLGIGGEIQGAHILELGGGTGVWSAAMAYRDPTAKVFSIDDLQSLELAHQTFEGTGMLDRWTSMVGDYRHHEVPLDEFDIVILPGIVQLEDDDGVVVLLGRATDALKDGGHVVIVEPLLEPDGPSLAIATHALDLSMSLTNARTRSVQQLQLLLKGAGLGDGQWGWLNASPHGLGLVVARKEPIINPS